jgi:hypothetical protein
MRDTTKVSAVGAGQQLAGGAIVGIHGVAGVARQSSAGVVGLQRGYLSRTVLQ